MANGPINPYQSCSRSTQLFGGFWELLMAISSRTCTLTGLGPFTASPTPLRSALHPAASFPERKTAYPWRGSFVRGKSTHQLLPGGSNICKVLLLWEPLMAFSSRTCTLTGIAPLTASPTPWAASAASTTSWCLQRTTPRTQRATRAWMRTNSTTYGFLHNGHGAASAA